MQSGIKLLRFAITFSIRSGLCATAAIEERNQQSARIP